MPDSGARCPDLSSGVPVSDALANPDLRFGFRVPDALIQNRIHDLKLGPEVQGSGGPKSGTEVRIWMLRSLTSGPDSRPRCPDLRSGFLLSEALVQLRTGDPKSGSEIQGSGQSKSRPEVRICDPRSLNSGPDLAFPIPRPEVRIPIPNPILRSKDRRSQIRS